MPKALLPLGPLLFLLFLIGSFQPAGAATERYRIDPEHVTVAFLVEHLGYAKILVRFNEVAGEFAYDPETQNLSALSVRIRTDSVDSNHTRRDRHIRDSDFLDASAHPTITFEMMAAEAESETEGRVIGHLTVRGVTRPVVLDVVLNKLAPSPIGDRPTIGISARTILQRSDFGMTYGLENGWVGDEVEVIIELEAIQE